MKMIMAIIQTHKLEDIRTALHEVGVMGMTVTESKGFGRTKVTQKYTEVLNIK